MTAEEPDPLLTIPSLTSQLQERFGGPHTQYAAQCFYTLPTDLTMVHVTLVMSCTQIFICDSASFVLRVALIERLLAVYQRPLGAEESEVLLVFDGEHDLLIRGSMICEGNPEKPFIPTLRAIYTAHYPDLRLTVHLDCRDALRDVAKLRIQPGYVAALPQKEEEFDRCPCWRAGDILNISSEEFAQRIRNIFIVHCPEKLPSVPEICRRYAKKRGGALQYLISKYGPEPSEEQARAVRAAQEREEKFAQLIGASHRMGNNQVQLQTLVASQKQKFSFQRNPLSFPQLLLSQRPSGGLGTISIRVTPIAFLNPQQPFELYRRRKDPPGQLWYLCNEGYVLAFETHDDILWEKFGYRCGERVLSTWGATRGRWSTIIGVRDGALWVHDDGELGATMLAGFESRAELERLNGWMVSGRVQVRDVETMRFRQADGCAVLLHICPEEIYPKFGVYHGERLVFLDKGTNEASSMQSEEEEFAAVAGIDVKTSMLYVQHYGPLSKLQGSIGANPIPVVPLDRCASLNDIQRIFGLRPTHSPHVVVMAR
jgi:hypothetical protein